MDFSMTRQATVLVASVLTLVVFSVRMLAEEPRGDTTDHKALAAVLYEKMGDPTFLGTVRFLDGVPLISRLPECEPRSQYYTSLILHASHIVQSKYLSKVSELAREEIASHNTFKSLSRAARGRTMDRIALHILGIGETGIAPVTLDAKRGEPQPGHDHPHERGHIHDHSGTGAPRPVGYVPSKLEVTTGMHALLYVDEQLKKNQQQRLDLDALLQTHGIGWQIIDEEERPLGFCRRLVDRFIPFVLHSADGPLLVCGYADVDNDVFLMAFDLGSIERRVSLNSSGASLTYSEYQELKASLRAQDPAVALDPLFWDYKSYFSRKNLPCFRLIRASDQLRITAIYTTGIEEKEVRRIALAELQRAVAENEGSRKEPARGAPQKDRKDGGE